MNTFPPLRLLLLLLLLALPVAAQSTPVPDTTTEKTEARAVRLGVVGASISAGYGSRFALGDALKLVVGAPLTIDDGADLLTFMSHEDATRKGLRRALAEKPDAVVGLDVLFWFVYGARFPDGDARLASLEEGLLMLESVEVPLFIGDLPRITDAQMAMLPPSAIPSQADLDRVNARIRSWAKERERVHVLPVVDWMKALRAGDKVLLPEGEKTFAVDRILHADRLHLSRPGVLVAAALVAQELARAGALPASALVADIEAVVKASAQDGIRIEIITIGPDGVPATEGRLRFMMTTLMSLPLPVLMKLADMRDLLMPLPLSANNPFVRGDIPPEAEKLGVIRVRAESDDAISPWVDLKLERGETALAELRMRPSKTLRLEVKNPDGTPAVGIEARAVSEAEVRRVTPAEAAAEGLIVRTDAEGHARLLQLGPGSQKIELRRDDVLVRSLEVEVGVGKESTIPVTLE